MTVHGRKDFLRAATEQRGELRADHERLQALASEHHTHRTEVTEDRDATLAELVGRVLPELTPPALARTAELTGVASLATEPLAAMEQDRARLEARRAEIEAEPRYVDRERLRAPQTGELVRRLAALEAAAAPHCALLARAAHPRLDRLLEVAYGTERYDVGWWRFSYYGDWKAGDEVLAKLPEGTTFPQVADEVRAARAALARLDPEIQAVKVELATGEALEREHEACGRGLATLVERHLDGTRRSMGDRLSRLELHDLADRLAAEPELLDLWKRFCGLARKIEYLDWLLDEQVRRPLASLQLEAAKLDRNIAKWNRPKNYGLTMDAASFERRFSKERLAKRRERLDRYERSHRTVYEFDGYDRARPVQDFLWWDLMTDGRIGGDFIPSVVSFRRTHPDYRYERPGRAEDEAAAAAAAAESDLEPAGRSAGTSFGDVS